jgi:hypothetical protein
MLESCANAEITLVMQHTEPGYAIDQGIDYLAGSIGRAVVAHKYLVVESGRREEFVGLREDIAHASLFVVSWEAKRNTRQTHCSNSLLIAAFIE